MNDPNFNYKNQPAPVVVPPPNQGTPQQGQGAMNYGFSAEELRVLRECNVESFYQRSLPLGIGLGVGTWLAVQRGILSASAKYGPTPKVVVAGILGYFIGKFSYQEKCAEKIMRLPNSKLAEALRRRKRGEYFEQINPDGGLSLAPFQSPTDVYTDETLKAPQNSLDLDFERPSNSGLDDTYRPSIDTPDRSFNDNLPLEAPKTTTTYEELRKKNREDYERKMHNPYYKPIQQDEATPVIRQREQPPPANDYQPQAGPKNKYGDVWVK